MFGFHFLRTFVFVCHFEGVRVLDTIFKDIRVCMSFWRTFVFVCHFEGRSCLISLSFR